MKQYLQRSVLKDNAKQHLAGKWGSSVLMVLSMFAISIGLSLFLVFGLELGLISFSSGSFLDAGTWTLVSFVLVSVLSCLLSVLGGLFLLGRFLFYLNVVSGQRFSAADLFFAFRADFGKNFLVAAAVSLPQVVLLLPYQICSYLFQTTRDFSWAAWMLVSLAVGIAIYIPISLSLAPAPLLLLDFPQYRAGEILRRSIQLMRGHRGRLFLLELSFLPVYFLCLFSLGVGFLWALPYMETTFVLFYLDLINPRTVAQDPQTSPESASVSQTPDFRIP